MLIVRNFYVLKNKISVLILFQYCFLLTTMHTLLAGNACHCSCWPHRLPTSKQTEKVTSLIVYNCIMKLPAS